MGTIRPSNTNILVITSVITHGKMFLPCYYFHVLSRVWCGSVILKIKTVPLLSRDRTKKCGTDHFRVGLLSSVKFCLFCRVWVKNCREFADEFITLLSKEEKSIEKEKSLHIFKYCAISFLKLDALYQFLFRIKYKVNIYRFLHSGAVMISELDYVIHTVYSPQISQRTPCPSRIPRVSLLTRERKGIHHARPGSRPISASPNSNRKFATCLESWYRTHKNIRQSQEKALQNWTKRGNIKSEVSVTSF